MWNARGVESIPHGEVDDIQAVADMIKAMQKAQSNFHGHNYGGSTTDIDFIITVAIDLPDAEITKEIIELSIKYGGDKEELYKISKLAKMPIYRKPVIRFQTSIWNYVSSTQQCSQTVYRFGDYAKKFSLVPSSDTQEEQETKETVKPDSHSDHILSDWLKDFDTKHHAEYQFQKYPWQTVAKVVVPKQDSFIPIRKAFLEDHITLDSWHLLKPLGSPNRL
ncbi:unnamed protein product [Diplocarpon coronariae]